MSQQDSRNKVRDAELQSAGDSVDDTMKEKRGHEGKDSPAKSNGVSDMKKEQHCHNDVKEQILSDKEGDCPAKLPEESNREDGGEIHQAAVQSDLSSLEDEFQNTPPLDEDNANGVTPNTPEKRKLIRTTTNHSKGCPWNPSRKLFQSSTGRKPKKSSTKPGKSKKREEFDCREISTQGVWVQCGLNHCHKWRYLTSETDPANIPHLWTCSMHPDDNFNSCDKSEEDYSQLEFIHNKFTEGSIVWAKMQGFPFWPAMVETDPDCGEFMRHDGMDTNATHYHCVFLDDVVSRSWVHAASVKKFEEHGNPPEKLLYKKKHFYKQMLPARERALDALKLSINERIHMYGFSKTFKGVWGKHIDDSSLHDQNDSEVSDGILGNILSSEDLKELQKETEEVVKAMQETTCDEMYQLLDTGDEQDIQRGQKRKAGREDEVKKRKSKKHKKHHKSRQEKEKKERKEGTSRKKQKGTEKKKKVKKVRWTSSKNKEDNDKDEDEKMEENGVDEMEATKETEAFRSDLKRGEKTENELALGKDEISDERNIDSSSQEDEEDMNEVMTSEGKNEAKRKEDKTWLDTDENTATYSDLLNDAKKLESSTVGANTSNEETESMESKTNRSKGLTKAEREQKRLEKAAGKQQRLEEKERKQKEREIKRKERQEKFKEKDARKQARALKKQQTEEQKTKMKQRRKEKEDKRSKTEDIKSQQKPPQRKPKFVAPKGKQTFVAPSQVTIEKEPVTFESVTANSISSTANPANVVLSNVIKHGPEEDTKHEIVKLSIGAEDCKDAHMSDSLVIERKKVNPAAASTKLKRKKFSVKRKVSCETKDDVLRDLSTLSKCETAIESCKHKKSNLTDRDGHVAGKDDVERRFVDDNDPVDEDFLDLEWSDSGVPSQQFKNIIASPNDDDSDPFEAVEE